MRLLTICNGYVTQAFFVPYWITVVVDFSTVLVALIPVLTPKRATPQPETAAQITIQVAILSTQNQP